MRNKEMVLLSFVAALVLSIAFLAQGALAAAVVSEGKVIKINYTLTVDGKVVDSSKNRAPLEVKIGAHQVIPGFEKGLMGMKVGEKKSFKVSPDEGYGQVNPKAMQTISRDQLPKDIKPAPGVTLYAQTPSGQTIPVKIVSVKKDSVVIDFNNPLAGKMLNFDVEVVDIK